MPVIRYNKDGFQEPDILGAARTLAEAGGDPRVVNRFLGVYEHGLSRQEPFAEELFEIARIRQLTQQHPLEPANVAPTPKGVDRAYFTSKGEPIRICTCNSPENHGRKFGGFVSD